MCQQAHAWAQAASCINLFVLPPLGSCLAPTVPPQLIRDKSDVPSNFTLKLRKHIRTRRLEAVRQLGIDRMVDFVFGSGEAAYHLILEMYSQAGAGRERGLVQDEGHRQGYGKCRACRGHVQRVVRAGVAAEAC